MAGNFLTPVAARTTGWGLVRAAAGHGEFLGRFLADPNDMLVPGMVYVAAQLGINDPDVLEGLRLAAVHPLGARRADAPRVRLPGGSPQPAAGRLKGDPPLLPAIPKPGPLRRGE